MGAEDRDRLLTAAELADYLAVPLRTIYAWRYQGDGPVGLRIGRHLRFRWVDVQAWLEECATRR
ncbi:helix-turn-helix transcriptional regulator [Euzebya sp.]|uniref:helix-turn-helix transcriptional regulator n=1 Tax=Euzebya sp. TaxID=1971409 RepID=UPI003512D5E3